MPTESHPAVYDEIGVHYADYRIPDPRIAAQITAALGDARSVCNVGAGTGAYEPTDRDVVAVEPSREMIAQRRHGDARVVRAIAERLPFRDGQFDASLAILTLHHWRDMEAGLAEIGRIARGCAILTFDPQLQRSLWLVEEYFPQIIDFENQRHPPIDAVAARIGATRIEPVPVPHDCTDGFQAAYWRRPKRYLEPGVRAAISTFAQRSDDEVAPGLRRLEADLASGAWHERHADLLERDAMDFGYRLIVREPA